MDTSSSNIENRVKELSKGNYTLVPYRIFVALERAGNLCFCPETQNPCCSSCIFFSIFSNRCTDNVVHVTLSCRSITVQLLIEL